VTGFVSPAMVPLAVLGAIIAWMIVIWLFSVRLRNASIVDIFWGAGFVFAGWLYFLLTDGAGARRWLVASLVTAWGLRLSAHLFLRNHGKGEDYRYREMREAHGPRFWWVSLFTVYLLQGLILWIVSLPLWVSMGAARPAGLTWIDGLGVAIFCVGLFFEALGDWQLARFKSDPDNRGKLLTSGLWRYTRHPNYFGDGMVWWGLTLHALATPASAWTLVSPLLMTVLLMKVSGVTLLEKKLRETKPGFREYMVSTSAFFPWFPRRSAHR
jgi:steroid 5-alpha reductase family enzyme